jgi:alkanesulfonate monooxygenase SsuD/methylene tetrahydromethanopterin reductase-like flavin-dependent oxidoreductase (luciferase family)
MPLLKLRYDLRSVDDDPHRRADRFAAALEQVEWADRLGFHSVQFHEHHGVDDGYLPSPIVFAAAAAARTQRIGIEVGALLVPLHDPLRLAEDLAVLDIIARGRLTVVPGAGYVPGEFAMFGKLKSQRGRAVERAVHVLRQAWTGQPFEYEGRQVTVTPRPFQRPGPPLFLGGGSEPAARRAARIGDGYSPTDAASWEHYRASRIELGHPDPGELKPRGPLFLYVADDPEAAWAEIGDALLYEMNAYGAFATAAGESTPFSTTESVEALRRSPNYAVITPSQCIELADSIGPEGTLTFRPLAGGLDPELSWRSLHLFETDVAPHIHIAPPREVPQALPAGARP